MGHAEELRDELKREGASAVLRLIRDATSEAEWVDYKRAVEPRDNLSQLATAFANASGGIIIWGVDAPSPRPGRSEAPIDAPSDDAGSFRTSLEGLTSGSCDPPVPGIEHFVLPLDGGPRGYVATYVPASPAAPHRDREHVHRLRVGSTKIVMPTAMLASYFGKRPTPSLSLVVALTVLDQPEVQVARAVWDFIVRNDGDGPLSDIFFTAFRTGLWHDSAIPPMWEGGDAQGHANLQRSDQTSRPFAFSVFADSTYRVAPRGLAVIARLTTWYSRAGTSAPTEFEGIVGAVGAEPKRWHITLTAPPISLIHGRQLRQDNASNRATYQLQLPADLLVGGEFMHHAYWRLARDHGSTNPSR